MGQLRVVRAEGDPHARGQQVGLELRDLVNESVDFYHRYLARRGVSSEQLQELLTPFLVASETHFPIFMEILKGMSVGAMVPVLELLAINTFEELEPMLEAPDGGMLFLQRKEGYVVPPAPRPERCTSFAVATPEATILAHNEHWLAGDAGNVAVVLDIPSDRPVRVASPTIVCCLPAVGVNSQDRQAFVGGDAFMVETTAERLAVLEGPAAHTNHYLDPELAALGPEPSPGSRGRLERLHHLLDERRPRTVPEVMDILRDHGTSSQSICQHADPDAGEEADAVLFSMVTELESGRMWVAPGTPCQTEYEEVDLTGIL